MKKIGLAVFVLMFSWSLSTAYAAFDEGIEYRVIEPPVATQTGNKIEVVELFWYGCPHCFRLEPLMKQWLKNKPDNVEFVRVPAIFNKRWELHAKAYYSAEALGVLDKVHDELFEEIHVRKKHLHNKAELRTFFVKHGVKAEDFDNTFDSFMVNIKVNRARDLSKRYGIDGVPSLVVNGKYLSDGPMAGGHAKLMKILDHLIKIEAKGNSK
ncbi:MAG: thiol:disulfide interchange protein DsbA/DsbL [Thioalkalispiraceae bacterium]|jgi:thiol:disulfide interchange protein DsbA